MPGYFAKCYVTKQSSYAGVPKVIGLVFQLLNTVSLLFAAVVSVDTDGWPSAVIEDEK